MRRNINLHSMVESKLYFAVFRVCNLYRIVASHKQSVNLFLLNGGKKKQFLKLELSTILIRLFSFVLYHLMSFKTICLFVRISCSKRISIKTLCVFARHSLRIHAERYRRTLNFESNVQRKRNAHKTNFQTKSRIRTLRNIFSLLQNGYVFVSDVWHRRVSYLQ